jgi:uncharacterized membrane protein YbhN (UPF0104 family)
MSARTRRRILTALRVGVSAAALWIAFGWATLGDIVSSVAAAGALPIVMALVIYVVSQGVSAMRWLLIARAMGFSLSPRVAITYYFIGMFFNLFGPSFLGGDLARSLYLARGRARMSAAVAAVALDRYVGFVWLAVLGSAALLAFGTFSLPERLVWAVHAMAIAALVSWFTLPRIGSSWLPTDVLGARVAASGIAVIFHLTQISAAVVLAHALTPSTPWRYCFVFHPLVAIVSALPVSIAGLGVRESGYVYFLTLAQGASASQAGAFAAAWLAIVAASSALGGLVFLVTGGRLPEHRAGAERDYATQFPRSS